MESSSSPCSRGLRCAGNDSCVGSGCEDGTIVASLSDGRARDGEVAGTEFGLFGVSVLGPDVDVSGATCGLEVGGGVIGGGALDEGYMKVDGIGSSTG